MKVEAREEWTHNDVALDCPGPWSVDKANQTTSQFKARSGEDSNLLPYSPQKIPVIKHSLNISLQNT